jgi:hypothetical protein
MGELNEKVINTNNVDVIYGNVGNTDGLAFSCLLYFCPL